MINVSNIDSTFISFMITTHLKEKPSHSLLDLFLKKAWKEFAEANEIIEKLAKEKRISHGKVDIATLENDSKYDFMRESIEDTEQYQSTHTCVMKTIDITIDGYPIQVTFYAKLESDVKKYEEKYWKRMMRWIILLFKYKKGDICFSRLHIKWFLFPISKLFSYNEEDTYVIQPKHVNTGYTYPCNPTTDIILFRMEDGFKVFLHETIHAFGIDLALCHLKPEEKNTFTFLNHYKIDTREVICEFYARLYWMIEYMYEIYTARRVKGREDNMKKHMHDMYFVTMHWSIFQGMRLLSISNTAFSSIFEKRSSEKKRAIYEEMTSAFSYYAVTAILLYKFYHTPDFFRKRKTQHSLDILDLNHGKIRNYFDGTIYRERKLKKIVECMENENKYSSTSNKQSNKNAHITPLNMVIF